MQDIREIEFRDSGSTQTPRYFSRFEPLLYVPTFTQKDFHYVTQDLPHREPPPRNAIIKLGVHNSSLQHNYLYIRGKAQSQNSITSKQEGWAQSQTTITSTEEG